MGRGNTGHRVLADKMQADYVERQVTFALADSDNDDFELSIEK